MAENCVTDLADSERDKWVAHWEKPSNRIGNSGLDLWQKHRPLFPGRVDTAIDFGHGTARLVDKWHAEGIEGHGVDIAPNAAAPRVERELGDYLTIAPLWDYRAKGEFQIGVAARVLEVLPAAVIDDSLRVIARSCETAYLLFKDHTEKIGDYGPVVIGRPATFWKDRALAIGGKVTDIALTRVSTLLIWHAP